MEDHEIACRAARTFARSKGILYRWREMWGAAWEGVAKARALGVVSPNELHKRAVFGIIDRFRTESGGRRKHKELLFGQWKMNGWFTAGAGNESGLIDHRNPDAGTGWSATKHLRHWVSPLTNLMAYLYYVEGYDLWDIATVFGVTDSCVSYSLTRFRENVEYATGCNGTASAPPT